jgi:hypothetical protein
VRSSDKEIKKAKTSEIIIGVCHHKKSAVTKLMTSADVIGRTQIDLSQFPFGEAEDDLSKPRVFPIFSRATENQVGDITVSIQRSKKALRVPNLLARRGTFSKPPCEQMRFNESHQNTLAMENAPVDPFAPQKRADGVVSELMIAADRGTEMDLEIVADLLKLVAEEAEIPYNWTNSANQNFLHLMIQLGHLDLINHLVDRCHLDQRDHRGCTALDSAVYTGSFQMTQIVLEANPSMANMTVSHFGVVLASTDGLV